MNWSDIVAVAATLFFVMDPLGNIPVFNAVLARFEARRRTHIVARELLFALVILLVFLFAGTAILDFLGLSQPALSIAGGVLLFGIALRMIFPRSGLDELDTYEEPLLVPLAMPLVAGPSTIAIVLLLSSREPGRIWEWCLALVLAWVPTALLLVASPLLMERLGSRVLRAMERFMGMLLILLATEMLLDGVDAFVHSL